jgi:hypothetical protein
MGLEGKSAGLGLTTTGGTATGGLIDWAGDATKGFGDGVFAGSLLRVADSTDKITTRIRTAVLSTDVIMKGPAHMDLRGACSSGSESRDKSICMIGVLNVQKKLSSIDIPKNAWSPARRQPWPNFDQK